MYKYLRFDILVSLPMHFEERLNIMFIAITKFTVVHLLTLKN